MKPLALHFASDVSHFIERRRDQAAEADQVGFLVAGGFENFFSRDHDTEVYDLVVVAAKDDADDVFADVMDITFDGGHDNAALSLMLAGDSLFLFHEGQQPGHGLFHDTRALDDLREEHFTGAEEVTDNVHA